jgi:hypothetical protein
MMPLTQSHGAAEYLRRTLIYVGRKSLWIAAGWVIVYLIARIFASGPLMLIEPVLGAIFGGAAGWEMGDNAVSECGFTGLFLWIFLVLGCWVPIWLVTWIEQTIVRHLFGWHLTFGDWMLLTMATLLSLMAALWRALADD